VPSRTAAILQGGPSPLPALLSIRDKLLAAGATLLAMPCNTAHYWHEDLARGCPVPFVSIVDAACGEASTIAAPADRIGLVATRATLVGRIFDGPLQAAGYSVLWPTEAELADAVLPSIRRVKEGSMVQAGRLLEPAVQALIDRGAAAVILACTETPIALDAIGSPLRARCIDSTRALALRCLQVWQSREVA
jgi:aspartate racemase